MDLAPFRHAIHHLEFAGRIIGKRDFAIAQIPAISL